MRTAMLLSGAAALGLSGCLDAGWDGPFPAADDVRLDVPGQNGDGSEGERGEAYVLVADAATDVNVWVADTLAVVAPVVEPLARHRETARDGDWLHYGPFDDSDEDRDLAWFVRVRGDRASSEFEVWVARRGVAAPEAMELLLPGRMELAGETRTGAFAIDMAVLAQHPALQRSAQAYTGSIDVAFERDSGSDRASVEIEFVAFSVGEAWSSDESYRFAREPDGSGTFELAVDYVSFVGRQFDRVELDERWQSDHSGRARGLARDVDNDLPHGDLVLDECFDAAGVLSFRELTDAYAEEQPGYAFGDERTCVFTADEL